LKDKHGVWVTSGIKRQGSGGNRKRVRGAVVFVNTGAESLPAEVGSYGSRWRLRRGAIIGGYQIGFCGLGCGIAEVVGAGANERYGVCPGAEAGLGYCRIYANVSSNGCCIGISYR
jgi:hypothetical protein